MSRYYPALILPKLILPILILLLIPVFAGTALPENARADAQKPAADEILPAETAVPDNRAVSAMADAGDATTLLVVGYDDESHYAGSILLIRLDKAHSTLRTVQISGNCYVRDPACPDGRLGSAFAEGYRLAESAGGDEKTAHEAGMQALADILQKTIGVRADGSVSLGFDVFRDIVDQADGVDIKLPRDFTCSDGLTLHEGKNHLDGESAERFVRFGEADGKINPQRLFLSSLLKKVKKEFPLTRAISLGCFTYRRVNTDLRLADTLALIRAGLAVDLSEARIALLSGAQTELDGVKLQIVNRNWARDLVNYYLDAGLTDDLFDPGERLTDPGNAEIEEIYRGRAPGMNGWGGAYNVPSPCIRACLHDTRRADFKMLFHHTRR